MRRLHGWACRTRTCKRYFEKAIEIVGRILIGLRNILGPETFRVRAARRLTRSFGWLALPDQAQQSKEGVPGRMAPAEVASSLATGAAQAAEITAFISTAIKAATDELLP